MDSSYLYKFFNNNFMLFKATKIKTLSLFKHLIKGPYLILKSEPSFTKTEDLIKVSNTFELIIY